MRVIHIIKGYENSRTRGKAWADTYCGEPTLWNPTEGSKNTGWANAATVYKYCERNNFAICPHCEESPDFVLKLLGDLP